jgi:hypothetical protein
MSGLTIIDLRLWKLNEDIMRELLFDAEPASVPCDTGESAAEFRKRMRLHCKDQLASYKVPQKVALVDDEMHGERFKKMRKTVAGQLEGEANE